MPLILTNGTVSDNQSISDKMSDNQFLSDTTSNNAHRQVILTYLAEHGEINAAAAAKMIGRSPQTARRMLSQLVKEGFIVALGSNRDRKYKAAKRHRIGGI